MIQPGRPPIRDISEHRHGAPGRKFVVTLGPSYNRAYDGDLQIRHLISRNNSLVHLQATGLAVFPSTVPQPWPSLELTSVTLQCRFRVK